MENEMPTLNEYFRAEAREFLTALERSMSRAPAPDAAEMHRAARGLRGTAQMAREDRVFRAISAFETVTRSLAAGALTWSDDVRTRARETVADLRALLDEDHADHEQLDARADTIAARWHAGAAQQHAAAPAGGGDERAFREFAGREVAGIFEQLDEAIQVLQSDPMDREPLRTVLRRQRVLLGSARLEELPVVAEILRAIEDLTRVIARLDIGVKKEWLDIYRVARDGLQGTIAALVRGENPEPSHSLSRLRHMRQELMDRYGKADQAAPAHDPLEGVQTQTGLTPPPAPAAADAVPGLYEAAASDDAVLELYEPAVDHEAVLELSEPAVEHDAILELHESTVIEDDAILELGEDSAIDETALLELDASAIVSEPAPAAADARAIPRSREDALRRALELRDVIARAAAHDPHASAAVDELFELLRSVAE
jgi:chemotaxis protein histidine kinase CheA